MENSILTSTINGEHQAAAPGATLDDIREFVAFLGRDAVLLAVHWGAKAPKADNWTKIESKAMADEAYLRSLVGGNIGVLLGNPSNGLCAIDIDSDEEAEAFLKLNPGLRDTLTTRGARGCTFWIQMRGYYPPLTKLTFVHGEAWGEFRSDGGQSVIFGVHPSGSTYTRLVSNPPVEMDWKELIWPDHINSPSVDLATKRLVEKDGHPITVSAKGGLALNQPALAEKFIMENPISFQDGQFVQYVEKTGLFRKVEKKALSEVLSGDLKALADEVNCPELINRRDARSLRDIMERIESKLTKASLDAEPRQKSDGIHVANGVIELTSHTGRLMAFHPSYNSYSQIPVDFLPEATCPRFENDLLKAVLLDEDVSLLQRYVGSMLLGPNHSQRILLIKGVGGSGKSTVLDVVEKLIGKSACKELRMAYLDSRFELADLNHVRLLTGTDVDSGYLSSRNASILKKLTGGDSINAEIKGGGQFQLKGNFHIIITSNPRLNIHLDGDAGAWERRLLLIEFGTPKHKTNIPDLASTLLKEEGPGILNFFLRGAMQYLEEKETHGGVALTPKQLTLAHDLIHESDSIRVFAEQMVERAEGEEALTGVLYSLYRDFCDAHEWVGESEGKFSKEINPILESLYGAHKSNHVEAGVSTGRGYKGIKLKGDVYGS